MNYEIFTDSTTDLPAELADKLKLHIIPYIFTLDGKDYFNYLDYRELSSDDFYGALKGGKLASTTQVTAHRYLEAWKPFLEDGKDIFYICLASKLSKSFEQSQMAARKAEETYPGRRVIAIDSKSASIGQGFLAIKAARGRDEGKTLDELMSHINETIPRMQLWVMADDLNHLKRGGRISGAKAVIGTMLNVKPILTFLDTGRLTPVGKARGRSKGLALFTEYLDKYDCVKDETALIAHGDASDACEQLYEMFAAKNIKEIIKSQIGPVIGAHTGPGTIMAMFYAKGERERDE